MPEQVTSEELIAKLRKKIVNQRRELRRLNKIYQQMWHGWRRGSDFSHTIALRGKMNATFGHEAVRAAEHRELPPVKPQLSPPIKKGFIARVFG